MVQRIVCTVAIAKNQRRRVAVFCGLNDREVILALCLVSFLLQLLRYLLRLNRSSGLCAPTSVAVAKDQRRRVAIFCGLNDRDVILTLFLVPFLLHLREGGQCCKCAAHRAAAVLPNVSACGILSTILLLQACSASNCRCVAQCQ